jgi:hypothetical protein
MSCIEKWQKLLEEFKVNRSLVQHGTSSTNLITLRSNLNVPCNMLETIEVCLSKSLSKTTLPKRPDPGSIALIVLLSSGFSFNHTVYTPLSTNGIYTLWKHIERVLESCVRNRIVTDGFRIMLLEGRSAEGFCRVFVPLDPRCASEVTRMRETILSERYGGSYVPRLSFSDSRSGPKGVYQSYETVLRQLLGYWRFPHNYNRIRDNCSCSYTLNASVPGSNRTFQICMLHPPLNVQELIVTVKTRHTLFHGDQVRHMNCYMDRQLILPDCIQEQAVQMIHMIDNESAQGVYIDDDNTLIAVPSRQCILHGTIESLGTHITVSTIRPTLNFMKCVFNTTGKVKDKLLNQLRQRCVDTGMILASSLDLQFSTVTLSSNISNEDLSTYQVGVTGEHVPLLFPPFSPRATGIKVVSISMGGCCIQLNEVSYDYEHNIPLLTVIETSMSVVCALTMVNREDYPDVSRTVENRKVVIKFHSKSSAERGSSITVGCYGGIQYAGTLLNFAPDYSTFCKILSTNVNSFDFQRAITTCREIVKPIYPSGIPRKNLHTRKFDKC